MSMVERSREQRAAVNLIFAERDEQERRYPGRTCAGMSDELECLAVLAEEFGEVSKEVAAVALLSHPPEGTEEKLRDELVQVAAVALAWIERLV